MAWGLLLDSGVVIRPGMDRGTARLALRFHNDRRRSGMNRGDLVTSRRAIGIAEMKTKPLPAAAPARAATSKKRSGLDDGPPLPDVAERRARAWATRRERYGEKGHS